MEEGGEGGGFWQLLRAASLYRRSSGATEETGAFLPCVAAPLFWPSLSLLTLRSLEGRSHAEDESESDNLRSDRGGSFWGGGGVRG